jgi:hypothetical protein
MRLDDTSRFPRPFFTEPGLEALRVMMEDGRLANPEKFAHVRQELGLDGWVRTEAPDQPSQLTRRVRRVAASTIRSIASGSMRQPPSNGEPDGTTVHQPGRRALQSPDRRGCVERLVD